VSSAFADLPVFEDKNFIRTGIVPSVGDDKWVLPTIRFASAFCTTSLICV